MVLIELYKIDFDEVLIYWLNKGCLKILVVSDIVCWSFYIGNSCFYIGIMYNMFL